DAVIDLADDESRIKRLAKIIKPGGAIVSTIGSLDIEAWRNRSIAAHNLVMNQTPQSSHSGLRELARMIEEGTLHVAISAERALQDAAQALEASKSGSTEGKVILTVETGRI
ncbi:MAG TPA: zinc-binding dehydrogenase, partial [Candidatus Baltobacteraceae bacterium]|nr:zinc-binding dehydrogenase [Candidatus Baltobacteraceae bacterium]